MDPSPRTKEATPLEQAVSRAMRDNLALVQHTAKELGQAIEDFVAACGSSRNANMLPSMLRAQTAAASLTSMLDVLSRLLTTSLQPARTGSSEAYLASMPPAEMSAAAEPAPARTIPPPPPVVVPATLPVVPEIPESPEAVAIPAAPPVVHEPPAPPPVVPEPEPVAATPIIEPPAPPPVTEEPPPAPPPVVEAAPHPEPVVEAHGGPLVPQDAQPAAYEYPPAEAGHAPEPAPVVETPAPPAPEPEPVAVAAPVAAWRVEDLPPDQQELHRRANRHAKVSMQDIYLLRPKDVQAARQAKDICGRLKGDIEKARKEYVRRFGPILEHPVDYFHHWMVEVLAEGKPEILGEYPYPSAAPRH